jgi:hypothetical protein
VHLTLRSDLSTTYDYAAITPLIFLEGDCQHRIVDSANDERLTSNDVRNLCAFAGKHNSTIKMTFRRQNPIFVSFFLTE